MKPSTKTATDTTINTAVKAKTAPIRAATAATSRSAAARPVTARKAAVSTATVAPPAKPPATKSPAPSAKATATSTAKATIKPAQAKQAAPKPERVKLVRDSFTMPKSDVELIASLKQRCLKLGHEAKKSELLRAGLHALASLQDEALVAAASSVPRLKTGRPGQKKSK